MILTLPSSVTLSPGSDACQLSDMVWTHVTFLDLSNTIAMGFYNFLDSFDVEFILALIDIMPKMVFQICEAIPEATIKQASPLMVSEILVVATESHFWDNFTNSVPWMLKNCICTYQEKENVATKTNSMNIR